MLRKNWILVSALFLVIIYLLFFYNNSINYTKTKSNNTLPENLTISKLQQIVQDYYKTHTYSSIDLFVCTDTSIDVWNLVKTRGINAKICAGNIEYNISEETSSLNGTINVLRKMNHAWVLAEALPFQWIALETTGGYLVWESNNSLYYQNICFNTPKEFKRFVELRTNLVQTCEQANKLAKYWDETYIGKKLTAQDYEFKGQVEQKIEECSLLVSEMTGLIT